MLNRDRQEIHCHGCGRFVQFILNFENDGNYEIDCPRCGHTHYRVIRNGRITDDRWKSSMQYTQIYGATSSMASSTATSYGASSTSASYYGTITTAWS